MRVDAPPCVSVRSILILFGNELTFIVAQCHAVGDKKVSMRKATPRIVIVTGANRGLGKEVNRQLIAQGDFVIVTARQLSHAQQVVKELGVDNAFAAPLDIDDQESVERLVEMVKQHFSAVDVLINNAAIHYDTWQNVINADLTTVKEAMETNVYGAWRMIQACLPLLERSQQARIVNVSSGLSALDSQTGSHPAYSMSKIALNSLTLMFANQLKTRIF